MKTLVIDKKVLDGAEPAVGTIGDTRIRHGLIDSAMEGREDGKSLQRWGGIAGMLGAILFILTAVALLGMAPETATAEETIQRFPENKTVIALGESLYLIMVILWAILLLALYHALRRPGGTLALVGSGLGFMGIMALTVGALPFVAFSKISDLYHASGATAGEKAQLVVMWQATQGIFNETDTVGYILIGVCLIVLGEAMLSSHAFGKRCGRMSIVFGVVSVVGMSLFGVDSDLVIPFVLITFVIYPLLFGWKLYGLSKVERGITGIHGKDRFETKGS